MKMAVLFASGFLAVATAACTSDGTTMETDRLGDTAATVAQTGTESTPNPAEVRWALRAREWISDMRALAGAVQDAVDMGRGALTLAEQELARRAIFSMYKCADRRPGRLASVAPSPPSLRIAFVNDKLAKACARLQRASLAASGYLLVDRPFNHINAERRRWKEEISVALALLESGDGELAALTSGV
jgi:hypothetical protein